MNRVLGCAIARVSGINHRDRAKLFQSLSSAEEFTSLTLLDVRDLLKKKVREPWEPTLWLKESEREVELCERESVAQIFLTEEGYPASLKEIANPPFLLYLKGNLPPDFAHSLAIVGTRSPTESAKQVAFEFALEATANGFHVISGGANGIDSCSHLGALALTGKTTIVMGSGFHHLFPREQRVMMERVLSYGGGWLSEYAPWISPRTYHFPQRNRIVVGLVRAVLIVEAPKRSGAMITAFNAVDEGRELLVHEEGVTGVNREGGSVLSELGAQEVRSFCETARQWRYPCRPLRRTLFSPGGSTTLQGMIDEIEMEKNHQVVRYQNTLYELESI